MLEDLKFVRRALSKKVTGEDMSHFRLDDGRVTASNGRVAVSSPIGINLTAYPHGHLFLKAIENCESEDTTITLTPTFRLSIKSGKFRCLVPCLPDVNEDIQPQGEMIRLEFPILRALQLASNFMSEDASRPWAHGVLLKENSIYATNNISIIDVKTRNTFPQIVIPSETVNELLRIEIEPNYMQYLPGVSLTFHYDSKRWVRTQLIEDKWPLKLLAVIFNQPSVLHDVPEGWFAELDKLLPFLDPNSNAIHITNDYVTTGVDGATVDFGFPDADCHVNYHFLMKLRSVVARMDLKDTGAPMVFEGDRCKGVLLGMRP